MEYQLPDKLTFKRTEVTRITRLDGKVIDYWEKEFGGLTPVVNKLGEKFYTRQDVELILKIKQMMIIEKMEKSRVKKILAETNGGANSIENPVEKRIETKKINNRHLEIIRKELQDILTILDKNGK